MGLFILSFFLYHVNLFYSFFLCFIYLLRFFLPLFLYFSFQLLGHIIIVFLLFVRFLPVLLFQLSCCLSTLPPFQFALFNSLFCVPHSFPHHILSSCFALSCHVSYKHNFLPSPFSFPPIHTHQYIFKHIKLHIR